MGSRATRFPLTDNQLGVWLASRMAPGTVHYYICDLLELRGDVDLDRLAGAVAACTEQVSVFWSEIVEDDGVYFRALLPARPLRPATLDLRDHPDPETACAQAIRQAQDEVSNEGQLSSITLVRLADRRTLVHVMVHHALIDGWSMALLHSRLARHYRGESVEPEDAFVDPISASAHTYAASPRFDTDREYWRARVAELVVPPTLTGRERTEHDRPVPALRARQAVPSEVTRRLREQAEQVGTSWSDLVFAASGAYLAHLFDRDELTIGTPMLGRLEPQVMRRVGMSTNGLPVTIECSPEMPWDHTVRQTSKAIREAMLRSRFPSRLLHADAGYGASTDRLWKQVINVMDLNYDLDFGAGVVARVANTSRPTVDDISVTIFSNDGHDEFEVLVDVDGERYTQADAEGHAARIVRLFADWARAAPGSPAPVSGLADSDIQRLRSWGRGPTRPSPDTTIVGLLNELSERLPEATAISTPRDEVSFAELVRRVEARASWLSETLGGVRGARVAICMNKELALYETLFAVLRLGGEVVLLDPGYPSQRIAQMVTAAAPRAILVEPATRMLFDRTGSTVLEATVGGAGSEALPISPASPDDPAYLVFTSGSTGTPKAVSVPHRGVVNVTAAMVDVLGSGPGTRTLQLASCSFDAFFGELTQSVLNGGTLVLTGADWFPDPGVLASVVTDRRVNDLVLPPSLLAAVDERTWPAGTTVSVVGEPCPPDVVARWAPVCRLFNGYGPTECTISSSMSEALDAHDAAEVPIGRPLRNVVVSVTDRQGHPQVPGGWGELRIAGAGVTPGYLGDDQRTAEKFVDDEWHDGPVYRTGDIVRWRSDGSLVFLGRDDRQVKVRGFRIELGDIEHALIEASGCRQCVAVVVDDEEGGRRIAGILVAPPGSIDVAAVRTALATYLPRHMVPSQLVVVAQLARTPNGKIDVRELRAQTLAASAPATTGVEARVLAHMADVLQNPDVCLTDNFFAMGGHSLAAARLLAAIKRDTGVLPSLRDFARNPTAAALSRQVVAGLEAAAR